MLRTLLQKPAFLLAVAAAGGLVAIGIVLALRSSGDSTEDRVLQPAPIDSLEIVVRNTSPPQYVAEIEAGLPGGCAEQADYDVVRNGNRIEISVRNSMPADPNTVCTAIYGTFSLSLDLGGDLVSGMTYTVDVNGATTTFDVAADVSTPPKDSPVTSVAGSIAPPATTPPATPLPADRRPAAAPIESVDVVVRESFPPQYGLHVVAGLPNGCAKPAGYEVERSGDRIEVTVHNSVPSDQTTICTMIYGMYELDIVLGSDFASGKTYTVDVNGSVTTFVAQ